MIAYVSTLLLVTGCAVGPDYSRPDLQMPTGFRMAVSDQETQSFANLPWWDLLQDEELRRLIRVALAENKDLQRAVASVEEFQSRLLISKMDFAPKADVTANAPSFGRKANFLFPGFPNPFNYYLQGNLSWELDIWGRVRRSNEAARGDLLAREEARRAVVLQLVSGVAEAYFELLQFDMQLGVAQRTLKSWEESVRIAEARLRQGMISRIDADQFEAERANAAARAAELTRQMVQKENQLSILLGRPPGQVARGRSLTEQVLRATAGAGGAGPFFDGAGVAAGGASRSAVRIAPASARPGAGRTGVGGGHGEDRGRQGGSIPEAQYHRHPGRGEPAVLAADRQRDGIRGGRPRPGRTVAERADSGLSAGRRRGSEPGSAGPV